MTMVDSSSTPYPALDAMKDMSPEDLERIRRTIIAKAEGNYKNLNDDDLQALTFVTSTLRRRTGGPPKVARAAGKKAKPTLEDIL